MHTLAANIVKETNLWHIGKFTSNNYYKSKADFIATTEQHLTVQQARHIMVEIVHNRSTNIPYSAEAKDAWRRFEQLFRVSQIIINRNI